MSDLLIQKRLSLPNQPGVYLMKNAVGEIIYVGKAKSIKKRVSSYFRVTSREAKTLSLMENLVDLDYIITGNELEALILECNLIKKHRPFYNIELKDNQRYPYIKITVFDKFPRMFSTRNLDKDGSLYFGPYPDAGAVKRVLETIRKLFRMRSCRQRIRRKQACLNFHIKRCWAPCEGRITAEGYREIVDEVVLFLKGRNDFLLKKLKTQMKTAARNMDFEKAIIIREQIASLEKISSRQIVMELRNQNEDVIALTNDLDRYCVVLLMIRNGQILGEKHFFLKPLVNDEKEILSEFIKRYYFDSDFIPGMLRVSVLPQEVELLEDWLTGRKGQLVKIHQPRRGRKLSLLKMAENNARQFLTEPRPAAETDLNRVLSKLQAGLGLKNFPRLIVGLDISNTGGCQAVGSLVAFEMGRKTPKLYRRFRIRSVTGIDDYSMMREVVSRYLKRVGDGSEPRPDLMLIDGGKGHLGVAFSALQGAGFNDIDIISLAKKEEEIFITGSSEPVEWSKNAPQNQLLMRVRDEAHRFAVTFHRQRRAGTLRTSALDNIPGIGESRKKELLKRFGSITKIKEATAAEIAGVKGVGPKRAALIKEKLR